MNSLRDDAATSGNPTAETSAVGGPSFTPGPWVADRFGGIWADSGVDVAGKRTVDICQHPEAASHGYVVDPAWKANALLIAAAPDLLASVKHLLTIIDRSAPELAGMMEYRHAREVIAKAEGRQ